MLIKVLKSFKIFKISRFYLTLSIIEDFMTSKLRDFKVENNARFKISRFQEFSKKNMLTCVIVVFLTNMPTLTRLENIHKTPIQFTRGGRGAKGVLGNWGHNSVPCLRTKVPDRT